MGSGLGRLLIVPFVVQGEKELVSDCIVTTAFAIIAFPHPCPLRPCLTTGTHLFPTTPSEHSGVLIADVPFSFRERSEHLLTSTVFRHLFARL
jgi:hypothetical protein